MVPSCQPHITYCRSNYVIAKLSLRKRTTRQGFYFPRTTQDNTFGMAESMGQNEERWSYDVFLSFRGVDVRDNFLSHLSERLVRYGINTFKDDEGLKRGENIPPALLKAIENSKIALVVFSENYASSSWCLDELVHIMKCLESDPRHMALPVFYNVDPSHVRRQRGSFGESFDKHNSRYPESKLQQWKDALTYIANLAGFHCRNEADLIDNVTREIIRILPRPYLHLPTYGVGMRSRVDHVERLCFGSDDVKVIGIYGMGGIGKTTLAKAAYNEFSQRFEGTSFLENCGEYLKKPEGKVHFQRQLLSDILRVNGEGTNMDHAVKTRFRNKRVFLVLDDVEDMTQFTSLAIDFSCFGPGSRIIITTRNKHLLEQLEVKNMFSPEKLDDGESFLLISRHAFRTSTPPEAFRLLSEELVKYCGGLPLAVEVLGCFLFKRSTSEWRSTLDLLKQNPNDDIQAKLQISFNALNQKQKDIFLDISCFFIGMDKDYVGYILDGCSLYPNIGLAVLKERCLISFSSDNRIMMHDLLRDMGRHIVRGTSRNTCERWSRLWDSDHVIDVLTNNSGTDAIEGLSLMDEVTGVNSLKILCKELVELWDLIHEENNSGADAYEGSYLKKKNDPTNVYCLKVKAFSKLRKLRLLQLSNVQLEGSYRHFPKGLQWLYWIGCPLDSIPRKLNLESSVVIDLQYSNLKRFWGDQEVKSIMQYLNLKRLWVIAKPPFLKMLKYLDLSHSFKLTDTPDFTYLPNLEKLLMVDCTGLVRVNKSIGTLHKLVLLNLKDCSNLNDLPVELYALKSLEILFLSGCWKLERLDDALGTLTSLKDLYLDDTSLFKIPDSINELISLKKLDISRSSVKEIPLKSGSLPCLTDFSTEGCEFLQHIPSSIGERGSLQRLSLAYTPIKTLPVEIGDLHSIRELNLRSCKFLNFLPENFGKLENLVLLDLSYCCSLRRLPESFGNLKSLHSLYMKETFVVEELPESLGNLSNLRVLKMSNSMFGYSGKIEHFVEFPNSFSNLLLLEELDAHKCEIGGKIPDFLEKLSYMRVLRLGCNSFHSLPSSLEGLSNLVELSLKDCRELECVPPLPWKLEKLNLANCFALKIISDLSKLEILHELNLINCEKVADIPGLEHLTALERLDISGCSYCCSLAVKKRLSKVSLKRMRNLSLPGNRIPDWFSQGPVTFSAQPNRELRSVIIAVVVAFDSIIVEIGTYIEDNIQAQIFKRGQECRFSYILYLYGLPRTNDSLHIFRYSGLHPMVAELKDGCTLQVINDGRPQYRAVELKMYGIHLSYEDEEDLLFGTQLSDSQKLANMFSSYEEGETSNSYMK